MSLNLAAAIRLDNKGFGRPLQQSRGQLATFTRSLRGMAGPLAGLAAGVTGVLGVVGQVRQTFGVIASFGAEMSKVGALSGASADDLERLTRVARELGATTKFSATEAAQGLSFLAMAGFSVQDSIQSLPQVLNLAAAGGIELGQAADIASNIMSAFGIAASELGDVVDDLATVATSSNTNIEQIGHAMSFAGPLASAFGISLQEVAASIGVLGDVGMGDRAGRQLSSIFRSLTKETATTQKALAKMGLTMADIDPAANSLQEILEKLAAAGMTPAQASAIFGEAATGILALTSNLDKLDQLSEAMEENEGAAQAMADAMSDNLAGDVLRVKSAIDELRLVLGDMGATSFFRGIVQGFGNLVTEITEGLRLIKIALDEGRAWELFSRHGSLALAEISETLLNTLTHAAAVAGTALGDVFDVLGARFSDVLLEGVATAADALEQVVPSVRDEFGLFPEDEATDMARQQLRDEGRAGFLGTLRNKDIAQRRRELIAQGLFPDAAPENTLGDQIRGDRTESVREDLANALMQAIEEASKLDLHPVAEIQKSIIEMIAGIRSELQESFSPPESSPETETETEKGKPQAEDVRENIEGINGETIGEILSDRLARIGGFVGHGGGPALDYARRTADATGKMVGKLDDLINQSKMTVTWS